MAFSTTTLFNYKQFTKKEAALTQIDNMVKIFTQTSYTSSDAYLGDRQGLIVAITSLVFGGEYKINRKGLLTFTRTRIDALGYKDLCKLAAIVEPAVEVMAQLDSSFVQPTTAAPTGINVEIYDTNDSSAGMNLVAGDNMKSIRIMITSPQYLCQFIPTLTNLRDLYAQCQKIYTKIAVGTTIGVAIALGVAAFVIYKVHDNNSKGTAVESKGDTSFAQSLPEGSSISAMDILTF